MTRIRLLVVVGRALVAVAAPDNRQPPLSRQPPQPPQPQTPFRAGVELVSLNVTVTDGTARYVTDLDGRGLQRLRRRRQAGRHVLQPHEPADRARAAARHEREHGTEAADGAGSRDRLRPQSCGRRISPRSSTSTAASSCSQTFTNSGRRARAGDPQDVGRRLDVALQRHLHRAEGSEEGRREERRRDPPPGDRRALGRRRHVEPAAVRRGARPREAIRNGDLRDRPARRTTR